MNQYRLANINKKPQVVILDQRNFPGGVTGYMGAYKGNAFALISPPNFPITKKTSAGAQFLWYASEVLKPMNTIHRSLATVSLMGPNRSLC